MHGVFRRTQYDAVVMSLIVTGFRQTPTPLRLYLKNALYVICNFLKLRKWVHLEATECGRKVEDQKQVFPIHYTPKKLFYADQKPSPSPPAPSNDGTQSLLLLPG